MVGLDKEVYMRIAENTGVFTLREIIILREVLEEFETSPGKYYNLLDEKQDNDMRGFMIFGRTPLTGFCWDIYWLVVDKNFQGQGIGRKLLYKLESFLLQRNSRTILRVETSARKEYAHARNLYLKQGFSEVGRIPDFYADDDGLVIFCKELRRIF